MANPLNSMLADAYGSLTRVFGGIWTRYGGWGWSRMRLMLPSARFDWEREAGDTWMSSVVARGLSWLGDRFPRPKVQLAKVMRNGDVNPVGRHPVVELWQRPNPYYTRRTLEKAIGLSLKVDGNAYVYKVRNGGGQVVELWWVPHYRILPTWPSDGSKYLDGYRVWLDTAVYHLPPEDIIHIRDGIDPRNERLGLSALRACLREVVSLNFAAGYTASLLKNSGVPSIAIVPDGLNPGRPDESAARRMEDRFVEDFGNDRTGRPLVMAGQYKIVEIGFSPDKLALSNLNRDAEARAASAIGVAAMSLGLPDPNKTYANLGEANRASWGTIVSLQELVAEAVEHQLFPDFGLDPMVYRFAYDYSEIQELQESLDAVHARTREDFRFDLIRKNEAREQLGYEPDPAGDVYFSDIQVMIAEAKSGGGAGPGGAGDEPNQIGPADHAPADHAPRDADPTETTPRVRDSMSNSDGDTLKALNGVAHPRWTY